MEHLSNKLTVLLAICIFTPCSVSLAESKKNLKEKIHIDFTSLPALVWHSNYQPIRIDESLVSLITWARSPNSKVPSIGLLEDIFSFLVPQSEIKLIDRLKKEKLINGQEHQECKAIFSWLGSLHTNKKLGDQITRDRRAILELLQGKLRRDHPFVELLKAYLVEDPEQAALKWSIAHEKIRKRPFTFALEAILISKAFALQLDHDGFLGTCVGDVLLNSVNVPGISGLDILKKAAVGRAQASAQYLLALHLLAQDTHYDLDKSQTILKLLRNATAQQHPFAAFLVARLLFQRAILPVNPNYLTEARRSLDIAVSAGYEPASQLQQEMLLVIALSHQEGDFSQLSQTLRSGTGRAFIALRNKVAERAIVFDVLAEHRGFDFEPEIRGTILYQADKQDTFALLYKALVLSDENAQETEVALRSAAESNPWNKVYLGSYLVTSPSGEKWEEGLGILEPFAQTNGYIAFLMGQTIEKKGELLRLKPNSYKWYKKSAELGYRDGKAAQVRYQLGGFTEDRTAKGVLAGMQECIDEGFSEFVVPTQILSKSLEILQNHQISTMPTMKYKVDLIQSLRFLSFMQRIQPEEHWKCFDKWEKLGELLYLSSLEYYILSLLAQDGFPEACLLEAKLARNYEDRVLSLEKAADSENPFSLLCQGKHLLFDVDTANMEQQNKAIESLGKAAEMGSSVAPFLLVEYYREKSDISSQQKWLQIAATNRHPEAQWQYGWSLLSNVDQPQNIEKAMCYLREASENGITEAKAVFDFLKPLHQMNLVVVGKCEANEVFIPSSFGTSRSMTALQAIYEELCDNWLTARTHYTNLKTCHTRNEWHDQVLSVALKRNWPAAALVRNAYMAYGHSLSHQPSEEWTKADYRKTVNNVRSRLVWRDSAVKKPEYTDSHGNQILEIAEAGNLLAILDFMEFVPLSIASKEEELGKRIAHILNKWGDELSLIPDIPVSLIPYTMLCEIEAAGKEKKLRENIQELRKYKDTVSKFVLAGALQWFDSKYNTRKYYDEKQNIVGELLYASRRPPTLLDRIVIELIEQKAKYSVTVSPRIMSAAYSLGFCRKQSNARALEFLKNSIYACPSDLSVREILKATHANKMAPLPSGKSMKGIFWDRKDWFVLTADVPLLDINGKPTGMSAMGHIVKRINAGSNYWTVKDKAFNKEYKIKLYTCMQTNIGTSFTTRRKGSSDVRDTTNFKPIVGREIISVAVFGTVHTIISPTPVKLADLGKKMIYFSYIKSPVVDGKKIKSCAQINGRSYLLSR